ncbi:MAG: hypothetical protein WD970_00855 [Patescibacteria group bacterium]
MNRIGVAGLAVMLALVLTTPSLAQNGRSARAHDAKLSAQERVAAIKTKIAEQKATVKADVCARRQERLNNVVIRLHNQATRLKTVIDTMFIRVQGFHDQGQLTVENYTELKAAVDTASADADAAVSAVETFTITIDCQNAKLGEQLDGFRTAIKDTRTALKDYRKALVDLISAMNNSAKAEDNAAADDNDDNGEEQ